MSGPAPGISARLAESSMWTWTEFIHLHVFTVFYFLYCDVLTSWGLDDAGRAASPRVSPFLQTNNWSSKVPSLSKPINPESMLPTTSCIGAHM